MGASGDWALDINNVAEVAATPLAELDSWRLSDVAYASPDMLITLLEHARSVGNDEMVGAIGAFAYLGVRISSLEAEGSWSRIPTSHNRHNPEDYMRVAKLVFVELSE